MHPVLFRLPLPDGPRPIYSYGVLVVAALAIGLLVGVRRAARCGVPAGEIGSVGLLAIAAGLGGAWLLFALVHAPALVADPAALLALVREPGLVFYGGLLGGATAVALYAHRFDLPLAGIADAAAVALPVAHAVGRIGCFLGGCCYGRPTDLPVGVRFTDPIAPAAAACAGGARLHPVQLYESAGLLGIAVLIDLGSRRLAHRPRGALFALYLGAYALLRLGTEALRGDLVERGRLGPLSVSQAIAAVMGVAAAALYLHLRRKERVTTP
jgi:phosphatidylglycerol:prolipoprotein diacylglycerol transferase